MNKLLKQAFTLIELLVVIAIIGILSGLIVVAMNGTTAKATIAKSQVFSNSLRNSLMLNLVSEWKFDGATVDGTAATNNDVLDTWNGINNGIIPVSPAIPTVKTASNCVSGSCLSFDGGDYVDCGSGSSLKITKDITISAWVKPNVLNADNRVFANFTYMQNGYAMNILPSGSFYFATWQAGAQQTTSSQIGAITINDWNYIVATRSGTTAKVYKNGVNVTSSSGTHIDPILSVVNARIGNDSSNSWPLNGLIDEVRIYSAAIPTSQIQEQYYAGLNKLLASGQINSEEYSLRINSIAQQ